MTTPRPLDGAALTEGRKLTRFNYQVIAVSLLITFFDGFDLLMLSHVDLGAMRLCPGANCSRQPWEYPGPAVQASP